MNIGRMRHRITIQEPIESKGAMGGTEKTWVKFHECWADIRELAGREQVIDAQLTSKLVATCFIRYKANIDSSMRIVHDSNIYQIESVINKDGKKKMLELPLFEFR